MPFSAPLFMRDLSCRMTPDEVYDDDDDDDEDDDEPPQVDVSQFRAPTAAFGLHAGRSSPSQRKGMGLSRTSTAKVFLCGNCASEFVKWMGRCPTCKEWNTLQEHVVTRQENNGIGGMGRPLFHDGRTTAGGGSSSWISNDPNNPLGSIPQKLADIVRGDDNGRHGPHHRRRTRILVPDDQELNTVLGGGLLPGSLILVGGSPGVGKSTLLLQMAASLAQQVVPTPGIGMGKADTGFDNCDPDLGPIWYVSGEETPDQIASRAQRLGLLNDGEACELYLWQETHVERLCQQVVEAQTLSMRAGAAKGNGDDNGDDVINESNAPRQPSLLIVDSIQTMVCDAAGSSAPGGITQVRESVGLFLRLAKSTGTAVILVGHVTKSGDVAGPRTVEHMVDCVLYLEGTTEGSSGGLNQLRILRANKNRFGSADEVGVYEMTAGRLLPVSDPSAMLMEHRKLMMQDVEGCAVSVALEGRRALMTEVQALVTMGTEKFARKTVDGIPNQRLQLLLGVMQKRCGLFFARQDVYLNVAGQIKLDRREASAADLAVVVALTSSLVQIPVRADTAFCGEVGLLGELRAVASLEKRVKEAQRMGFSRIITARDRSSTSRSKTSTSTKLGIEWIQCQYLMDALNLALVDPLPKRQRKKKGPNAASSSFPETMEDLGLDKILDDEDEGFY